MIDDLMLADSDRLQMQISGIDSSMDKQEIVTVGAEDLAYWYLRLNGFFTIPNFIVHPKFGKNQRTDIDILAVRFPFREELKGMTDDEYFERFRSRILVVFAEVKAGRCSLNDSWLDPQKDTLVGPVSAAGMFPPGEVPLVVQSLRESGKYSTPEHDVTFTVLGSEQNQDLLNSYPEMPQILSPQVLRFIYERFEFFMHQKWSHGQWGNLGKML